MAWSWARRCVSLPCQYPGVFRLDSVLPSMPMPLVMEIFLSATQVSMLTVLLRTAKLEFPGLIIVLVLALVAFTPKLRQA